MQTKRIFMIDDHRLFIEGIILLLKSKPDLEVVGWANSASEYYEMAETVNADLYLVDVHLPGESGMDVVKRIRQKDPGVLILALSMFEDTHYIERMLQSGANGYLFKSDDPDELVGALREARQGQMYFSQDVQQVLNEELDMDELDESIANDEKQTLSKREIEILSLIAQDFSTQEIAEKLYISARTVDTHRKNILTKTQTKTIVGMIKYAIREGLVQY